MKRPVRPPPALPPKYSQMPGMLHMRREPQALRLLNSPTLMTTEAAWAPMLVKRTLKRRIKGNVAHNGWGMLRP